MRGAAYLRVSTNDQAEFSPEAQRKAILDYAGRNAITIQEEHIYLDEGFSGKRAEKRPAFMSMIYQAKTSPRPFDVILVHRFDRFARNREDSVIYKSLLRREHGIRVISITEQLEDDKFSVILESMLEGMAEYYSLNLADEVKKGMREKATRGGFQSRPPYGYEVKEHGKLSAHPVEGPIVVRAFDQYVRQSRTFLEIARELNAKGYRTKKGNKFQRRSIQNIINNPLYYGLVRWNRTERSQGKVIKNKEADWISEKGDFQPLITEGQWKNAQLRYQREKQGRSEGTWKNNSLKCKHYLRGLLRCKACGGTLVYGENKSYGYYRCNNKLKGTCSESQYMSRNRIEEVIISQLSLNLPNRYQVIQLKDEVTDAKFFRDEKEQVKAQLKRAKEAYITGIDTIEEYEENKKELLKHLETIDMHIGAGDNDKDQDLGLMTITDFINNKEIDHSTKNKGLKSIIKEIIVDKKNDEITFIYY